MGRIVAMLWSEDRRRSFRTRIVAASLLPRVSVRLTVALATTVLLAGLAPIAFTIASGIAVGAVPAAVGEARDAEAFDLLVVALVVAGGLLGSSLIGIFAEEGPMLLGLHFLSVLGFLVSGLLGAWLLLGVVRSGRL